MIGFVDLNIHGPDVSFYQDDNGTVQGIDFAKMKAKADFVIIRGGQNVWTDSDFKVNWKTAKQAGLPRGSYWLFDSRVAPEAQAEIFASLFKDDKPEIGLWLDLEENYFGKYAGYANWEKYLERLKILVPHDVEIGIYTSLGYAAGKIPFYKFDYFRRYPLWLAAYARDKSIKPDIAYVKTPVPWRDSDVRFWQWGTPKVGADYGAESIEIDMNIYNGTRESFNYRYKLDTYEHVENGDDVADITLLATVKSGYSVNVREAADTSATIIGTVSGAVTIQGVGAKVQNDGYDWIQIVYPKQGWVALTTNFDPDSIKYTPPVTETKKVVKSIITFDDGSTLELFPK